MFGDAAMSSVIFFDKKNIEEFAVSSRVAVMKILCIDDPGWHVIGYGLRQAVVEH